MTDESDQALVAELAQRSATVWARLYDRHAEDVFRFVAHLLHGDLSMAEELHQETWLAALSRISSYDPARGELRAWIFGIARQQVAARIRRQRRLSMSQPGGNASTTDMADGESLLPLDVLQAIERGDAVRAALAELGSDARRVLLGKYVDEHSVAELSAELGRSPKAIESLLSRARSQLRKLLRWYFEHDPSRQEIRP